MDSTNIIVILLFILPGYIADKVHFSISMPKKTNKSTLKELLSGILSSIPIALVSALIYTSAENIKTFDELTASLKVITNIKSYLILVVFVTIIYGIIIGGIKWLFYRALNWLRKYSNSFELCDNTCWMNIFLKDCRPHFVKVIMNGKEYDGFIDDISLVDEDMEISLNDPDYLDCYPDYKKYFTKVRKKYINIEKNIVILDYDMTGYNKFVEETYMDD